MQDQPRDCNRRNLIASIIFYLVSALSTFFLIPLVKSYLGIEAYGYIAVALGFSSLASVVTISVTPMVTRFLSMTLTSGDERSANRYYSTSIVAVIALSMLIIVCASVVCVFINNIMVISQEFVQQVKVLILILAASLCVNTLSVPFSAGLYYRQTIYVYYLFQAASQTFRILFPLLAFALFSPQLWLPYLGSLVVDFCGLIYYYHCRSHNLPNLRFMWGDFDFGKLKTMLASGIWMSISKAGNTLMGTLNSYYSNLILGSYLTGLYSSFCQVQSIGAVFATTVAGSFLPELYRLHAINDDSGLGQKIEQTTKYLSLLLGIVSGCLLAYSCPFISLWLNIDGADYQVAIWLLVFTIPLAYASESIANTFVTTNKLRIPAIATLICGCANVALVILLCGVLDFGLVGLVIAQGLVLSIRSLLIYIPYASHLLPYTKVSNLYGEILLCIVVTILTGGIGFMLANIINVDSWASLLIDGSICVVCSSVVSVMIFLQASERRELFARAKK